MRGSPRARLVPRIALVLWNGGIGGAETATLTLARFLRAEGCSVTPVFVGSTGFMGDRFEHEGFPIVSLGATPGSRILLAPRHAARIMRSAGTDGVILVSGGILAVALRVGGYFGPIIAVEHGSLAQLDTMSAVGQIRAMANWSSGTKLVDVFVGVSQFMVDLVRKHAPGCHAVHVPNGIDTAMFAPRGDRPSFSLNRRLVIGCAGRLIEGKGFEDAIDAAVSAASRVPMILRIAGDGPLRASLASRSRPDSPGLTVEFTGWCTSMPNFWNDCDIAVVPSSGWIEAFGMTALEALACGIPVIASDSGGLPEVVADGICGLIYPAGDVSALSDALVQLGTEPIRRRVLGESARERVIRCFDATHVARTYIDLLNKIDQHASH